MVSLLPVLLVGPDRLLKVVHLFSQLLSLAYQAFLNGEGRGGEVCVSMLCWSYIYACHMIMCTSHDSHMTVKCISHVSHMHFTTVVHITRWSHACHMTCTYMLVGQGLKRLMLPLLLFHVFLLLLQLHIEIHTEHKVTAINTIYSGTSL